MKVRKAIYRRSPTHLGRSLQWGRTREGAEGRREANALRFFDKRFSGAAPVKVRKGNETLFFPNNSQFASVGPHP